MYPKKGGGAGANVHHQQQQKDSSKVNVPGYMYVIVRSCPYSLHHTFNYGEKNKTPSWPCY